MGKTWYLKKSPVDKQVQNLLATTRKNPKKIKIKNKQNEKEEAKENKIFLLFLFCKRKQNK